MKHKSQISSAEVKVVEPTGGNKISFNVEFEFQFSDYLILLQINSLHRRNPIRGFVNLLNKTNYLANLFLNKFANVKTDVANMRKNVVMNSKDCIYFTIFHFFKQREKFDYAVLQQP